MAPLDFSMVRALENMVVGFLGSGTKGATVVSVRFTAMNSGTTGEFLPAKFVEKGMGAGEFGVH